MRRKRVAVLMASIDREYQQVFASGLASAGAENDMDICIFNSQGHMNFSQATSEACECRIYDLPEITDYDGVISLPDTMGNELAMEKVFEVLKQAKGKPHISIDMPQEDAVAILFDDRMSMEQITEHLITEHGARNIAFVSGPFKSTVAMDRVNACREAMARHGLMLEDRLLFDGQWTRVGGRNAAEQILAQNSELPDAVICGNDDMALSVIQVFIENGVRVPEDVSVTGFDALHEAVARGLTTIRRPIDLSAKKAIEILTKWIEGEKPKEDTVYLPTIPVYGDSCGCVRKNENLYDKLHSFGTERWNIEKILTRVSMFSGIMAGVGNESEAREKMREFVRVWNMEEIYLCVEPSLCRENTAAPQNGEYSEELLLLYGNCRGREYNPIIFPTRELCPAMEELHSPACLVFCPLYYRDQNLGYVAMNLGIWTGTALYSVLMLLNGTLISLYLQNNMRRSSSIIRRMASHDIMTGMLNRRGYMELAPAEMEQARAAGKCFVMLSADMNYMKKINDKFGHLMGDEAICRMGRALRKLSDYGFTPVHISGDEFLAYGTVDTPETAESILTCVNQELDRINHEEPWICEISASFGIYAAVPGELDTIDQFLTMADRAMYADKRKRKYGRRREDVFPDPP